jgi:signal transduction histidine kinase
MLQELLASRPGCQNDPKAVDYLAKMRETVHDLQDLLEQVEDLGRALGIAEEADREAIPFGQLLLEVAQRLQGAAAKQGAALEVGPAGELPEALEGDRRWVVEVLQPVIEGALKVGVEGGVVVEAHPPQGLENGNGEVLITVRDTGPPPAEPQGFFEPFAHTDPRARRARGGRSLRLCAAERRAVGLGGRLTVAHDPRGGAVFTLHLPVTLP